MTERSYQQVTQRLAVHITVVHNSSDNRIFQKECQTLAAAGYTVKLVAPGPEGVTLVDGIEIISIGEFSSRLARMTRGVLRAYQAAVTCQAKVYHLHDPELMWLGLLLRAQGKVVILDAHEDLPDDVLTKDYLPRLVRKPLAILMSGLIWSLRFFYSGFISATPTIARRFPAERTVIIHNFPREQEILPDLNDGAAPRPPKALYLGSITKIRGIYEMVEAIKRVATPPDASLLIAGRFESDNLRSDVQKLSGWRRVEFCEWLERNQLSRIMSQCALGLVLFHPLPAHLEALPNKLFEYMAAGLPIIVSDFPLWRRLIGDTGCGLVVNPLDIDQIAEALTFLFTNPSAAKEMGAAGREAVRRQFNWGTEARRLLRFYRRFYC
jgi:glycosyltransferase involved in cell wall biosynthesis